MFHNLEYLHRVAPATETHMNSETVTAHTRPAQVQTGHNPRTERGKQTKSPAPNQEVICNCYTYWEKEKSIFSKKVSLGLLTTLQGRP